MKASKIMLLMLAAGLALFPMDARAASDLGSDSVVDKAGDWFATIGKEGSEKEHILTQRKMERISKRMQHVIEKESKAAGKEMKKAGKEMEKMFK